MTFKINKIKTTAQQLLTCPLLILGLLLQRLAQDNRVIQNLLKSDALHVCLLFMEEEVSLCSVVFGAAPPTEEEVNMSKALFHLTKI